MFFQISFADQFFLKMTCYITWKLSQRIKEEDEDTKMGYISLKHIGHQIEIGHNITFRVKYNKKGNYKPGGMAINFRQQMGERNDIILHFNPRYPSFEIVLNSFVNGRWQKGVSTGANSSVFSDEFTLSLDIKDSRTVLVRVQGGILTTYTCPLDITNTEFIEFSPEYRITEELKAKL